MLYTILIFRDFIFKENALFTYFIVFFLYETVKTTESILNSDDIVYPFLIFRLFVFVLPKCVFLCSVLFFAQSITVVISIIFGIVVCQQCHVCPRNIPRTFREMSTFNHETPHEQSARRRGPIHRVRIFTLLNMHIRFLVHVCPHYQIRISIPPHTYVRSSFCGFFIYAGTINRTPTAADGLPFCGCLRICKHHKIVYQRTLATCYNTTTYTECLLLHCKNHTFAM